MANLQRRLKALEISLSQSESKEDKISQIRSYVKDILVEHPGIVPTKDEDELVSPPPLELTEILGRHELINDYLELLKTTVLQQQHHPDSTRPLDHILCANQFGPEICRKNGTKICAACRLVAYCSPGCQKNHWGLHKSDCKHEARAKVWHPAWVKEGRKPAYISSSNRSPKWVRQAGLGMGYFLWGNMPAIDIINVISNEGIDNARTRDFSLAFIASGDLRNVIRTVNALPEDYEGKLSICLNDHKPISTLRNFIILSLLGLEVDESLAAEYALHIWYSVLLPQSYIPRILPHIFQTLQKILNPGSIIPLGGSTSNSTLQATLGPQTLATFTSTLKNPSLTLKVAQTALQSIMSDPQRIDYRDRALADLEPSHRLAILHWRSSALLLPFRAPHSHHFDTPNPWMYSPDGRLYLTDNANPLNGWDIDGVIASGKRHGVGRGDIIGSLFFHIKDQLIEFIRRLHRFKISFSIFDLDAIKLASQIHVSNNNNNQGILLSIGPFDRIEVSNIIDQEYVGLERVLKAWGPLLNPLNPHSAIIGLFINWIGHQPGAEAANLPDRQLEMMLRDLVCRPEIRERISRDGPFPPGSLVSKLDAIYDNSKAFDEFLTKIGSEKISKIAGLKLRDMNLIIPHRPGVSIRRPWNTIPVLDTEEKWYCTTTLAGWNITERYVEWIRA